VDVQTVIYTYGANVNCKQ